MTEYDTSVPKDDEKPRMGRPPRSGDAAAEIVITIRVTADEKAAWIDAAGDQPLAGWIRDRCNRSAARR